MYVCAPLTEFHNRLRLSSAGMRTSATIRAYTHHQSPSRPLSSVGDRMRSRGAAIAHHARHLVECLPNNSTSGITSDSQFCMCACVSLDSAEQVWPACGGPACPGQQQRRHGGMARGDEDTRYSSESDCAQLTALFRPELESNCRHLCSIIRPHRAIPPPLLSTAFAGVGIHRVSCWA